MTGKTFADLCAAQIGQAYAWGGLGYTMTEARIAQLKSMYPKTYTPEYIAKCRENIGQSAFDCAGLVKHFLWGNTGDGVLRKYATNGIPDTSANGLLQLCKNTGRTTEMPDIPGLLLHTDGHVGVYIGGGQVIEARGINYGVVLTNLNSRPFSVWGKLPTIAYAEPAAPEPAKSILLEELAARLKTEGFTSIEL